jgi:hypothetical protein
MRHDSAIFLPKLVTQVKKKSFVYDLFECAEIKNFLKNIITGDETWIYGCNPETKRQLLQMISVSLL